MLLALDLGTRTGWATYNNKNIISGFQDFKEDRFSGGGMRFLKFEKWLNNFEFISHVVFEEVRRHKGTDASHVYGGFLSILTKWCEERVIPYQGIPVATIKKNWTGKGTAKKDVMINEAKKRGYIASDDNEVDAIAILDYWIKNGTFKLNN